MSASQQALLFAGALAGPPAFDIPAFFGTNRGGWYEFVTAATVFSDTAATVPAVIGGVIGAVTDRSGLGNKVTRAASLQPTFGNSDDGMTVGRYALATSDRLSSANSNYGSVNGMVCGGLVNVYQGSAIIVSDYDVARVFVLRIPSDGSVLYVVFGAGNEIQNCLAPAGSVPFGVETLVTGHWDGADAFIRVNGVQVATAAVPVDGTAKATATIDVGCNTAGGGVPGAFDPAKGYLKIAMFSDGLYTVPQLQAAESYMNSFRSTVLSSSAWNPADKDADVQIASASSNRAAILTSAGAATGAIRATTFRSGAGKFQVNWLITGLGVQLVGFGRAAATLSNFPGIDTNGFGYYDAAEKYNNGFVGAYGAAYNPGDVVSGLVDFNANEMRFMVNGVDQGIAFSGAAVSSAALAPMWGPGTAGAGTRGATLVPYTLASGYSNWG